MEGALILSAEAAIAPPSHTKSKNTATKQRTVLIVLQLEPRAHVSTLKDAACGCFGSPETSSVCLSARQILSKH